MSRKSAEPSEAVVRAWARLVRSQHALLAAVEADLKQAGFPPLAWYDALLELRREPGGRLRPFELEGRMLLRQYNLSRLIDRLAEAGYVARHPCPEDRRGQVLEITAEGRELLRTMWPAYAAAIDRRFGSRLDAGEAERLADLLGKLVPQ